MNGINEIERLKAIGFSRSQVVEALLQKGIALSKVKNDLDFYYPEALPVNKKSFRFRITFGCLTLLSLAPLMGIYIMGEYQHLIFTLLLLAASFGFYKLNRTCIIIWLAITGLSGCYTGIFLVYAILDNYINSLYSFGNMLVVVLFSSALFSSLLNIYNIHKRYKAAASNA